MILILKSFEHVILISTGGNQIFEYSKSHEIKAGGLCLDSNGADGVVKLSNCNSNSRSQKWDYDNEHQYFRNRQTSSCLTINETNNNVVITMNCDSTNNRQKWMTKDPVISNDQEEVEAAL